jgi:hypothetical protein
LIPSSPGCEGALGVPSLHDNLRTWDDPTSWTDDGDEWSRDWGGAKAQWEGCIFPRIRRFLPVGTVLEIAPGHGRWTQFLVHECDRYVGVDLSAPCVDICRARFKDALNAAFHVNDGRSLDSVADGSVDFAFSFDSLVHVERDVLADYLTDLADKLSPTGVAFIHHSNLGEYPLFYRCLQCLPARPRMRLNAAGVWATHWRAPTVTAEWFAQCCRECGLQCIGQEIINWGTKRMIDCISVVTRPNGPFARPNRVVRNRFFVGESGSIRLRNLVHE